MMLLRTTEDRKKKKPTIMPIKHYSGFSYLSGVLT